MSQVEMQMLPLPAEMLDALVLGRVLDLLSQKHLQDVARRSLVALKDEGRTEYFRWLKREFDEYLMPNGTD